MTVTERLMLPGSWSLRLSPDTPPSVLDVLDLGSAAFGHVVVTPTRLHKASVSGATLLAAARYTGILRSRPSLFELGGPGLAAWLADEDGKGDVIETALTKSSGTFVQWVTDLRPSSLTAGTYTAIAGSLSHSFLFVDRRTALDYVCDYFGGEWRITPAGALDAGAESDLFATTPTVVVQRLSGGKDIAVTGIHAALDTAKDYDDYTTRVVLVASGDSAALSVGTADISPATSFKDLNGNAVDLTRIVESSDTTAGNETVVAQAQLNRFTDPRRAVTLTADEYDIGASITVGDTIYVWDPATDLTDTANQVQYRGQTIFPMALRVLGYSWSVQRGMGVYFRAPDAGGTITDLTDFVEWDTGTSSIEVGAKPRPSTDTVTSSVQRPAALGPQGAIGYGTDTSSRTGFTAEADLNNCSDTVSVGPSRRLRITGHALITANSSAGFIGKIKEGTTVLGRFGQDNALNTSRVFEGSCVVESPSAGSHTYKLTVARTAGAGTVDANNDLDAAWILIEDIGPAI